MRLLLLLSALFAAFAGVTGSRAEAQPVQASALAAVPIAAAAVVSSANRFTAPAYGHMPPFQPPSPPLVAAVVARILYAERRRE